MASAHSIQALVGCSARSLGGSCLAQRRAAVRRSITHCNSKQGSDGAKETLSAPDSLVPSAAPPAVAAPPAARKEGQGDAGEEGWAWFDRPATPPKGPLRQRGMEAGASGQYLDSEKFTRDPLQLNVGARTSLAAGAPPQLPDAPPRASRALAAAVLCVGGVTLTGLVPPLSMLSLDVWLGASWQLLTASVQPWAAADMAAAAAVLLTAGAYAERRLGPGILTASFFLTGASAWLLYTVEAFAYPLPLEVCGPALPLLGCSASLAAFAAANWRVLGAARQRGASLAAAAGLAAVSLATPDVFDPLAALLVAGLGGLLGWAAGPNLEVLRELDIADNAMTISGDEAELEVVVDRRTRPGRWLPLAACAALLAWQTHVVQHDPLALALAGGLGPEEQEAAVELALRALRSAAADPEVQQELFELAPDKWSRNA